MHQAGQNVRHFIQSVRIASWALLAAIACLAATPAIAEKRIALAIGNDLYPNLPADRQLKKAANDATTIAGTLRSLGFEVIVGTNLGRQAMIDKLAEFTARLQPGDTAALFFAGHGVAIAGVNYLIPSDVPAVTEGAEARVRGASLAEPDLIAELQARSVRVALLVIDACRDNPFPRAAGRSIGNTRGLADAKPARGIFTLYSAGIGQTALDRLGGNDAAHNSVFTRIFAEQLKRPDLHLGDLAVEVRERVAELALKATDARGQPAPHEQTHAFADQVRVFGVMDDQRVEIAGIGQRTAHHLGVGHAPVAIGEGHGAGGFQEPDLGHFLAAHAFCQCRHRVDVDDRGVARTAQHEVHRRRIVDHGEGIRLADDGGDPAGGRRLAGGGKGLAVAGTGLADKGAHVDQPGGDDLAGAIDDVGAFGHAGGADAALGVADGAIGYQHVAGTVEIPGGIDDAGIGEQYWASVS